MRVSSNAVLVGIKEDIVGSNEVRVGSKEVFAGSNEGRVGLYLRPLSGCGLIILV